MGLIFLNMFEHGRATEWLTSFILLGFAVALAAPGDTLASSAGFRAFVQFNLSEASISTPLAIIAVLRIVALQINGRWRRSPLLRLAGAVLGAALFSILGMAFLWPSLIYGAPLSTGVATYFLLAFFDGLSAYRSAADARALGSFRAWT